ncbi:CBS domain-containing protein, partial [Desulfobulbus sp. AH-315-M07]|nr:CBS domain-containing protein [Desulfobulbus sp. AH-315-M07]
MKSWRDCLVKPGTPIREALQRLDSAALQIILLVDDDGVLFGTVTDGDIRRAMLRSVDFSEPIETIAHRTPTTVKQNVPRSEIAQLMRTKELRALPVVDQRNIVVGVEFVEGIMGP